MTKLPDLPYSLLFEWFEKEQRLMPWRKPQRSFYEVLVSEIMCQQTQVDTVIPYYLRFMKQFPTLKDLADSDEQTVMKLWEGLGYYRRARFLCQTAREIVYHRSGQIPNEFDTLIKMSGIGHYTASAIMSFVYHQDYAVCDGNIKRILSRFAAIKTPINTSKGEKKFRQIAQYYLVQGKSRSFNESLMECGATICKKDSCRCDLCPLSHACLSNQRNLQSKFPVTAKKKPLPIRYFDVFCIENGKELLLEKPNNGRFLGGLYRFPEREVDVFKINDNCIKHSYSHFKVIKRIQHHRRTKIKPEKNQELHGFSSLKQLPFDKASQKIIAQLQGVFI